MTGTSSVYLSPLSSAQVCTVTALCLCVSGLPYVTLPPLSRMKWVQEHVFADNLFLTLNLA